MLTRARACNSGYSGYYHQPTCSRKKGAWATRPYVGNLAYSSPEVAAPWAETLTDQNTRFNQIENIARHWLEADRPTAEAWLAKVNLPDDRRQRLLKRP